MLGANCRRFIVASAGGEEIKGGRQVSQLPDMYICDTLNSRLPLQGKILATSKIGFFPSNAVRPCPCVSARFTISKAPRLVIAIHNCHFPPWMSLFEAQKFVARSSLSIHAVSQNNHAAFSTPGSKTCGLLLPALVSKRGKDQKLPLYSCIWRPKLIFKKTRLEQKKKHHCTTYYTTLVRNSQLQVGHLCNKM